MTIIWQEETGSRSATIKRLGAKDTSSCDVKFRLTGAYDDVTVHGYAANYFNAFRLRSLSGITMLVVSYDVEHLGGDAWEVTAHYESQGQDDEERPEAMKRSRSFDTTGATHHMSCGYAERKYPDAAPNMNSAIEVDEQNVKGVDVVIPALQWQESYDVPASLVTDAYVKTVASLTGCVNEGNFRSFAAGEVLFAGCSGSQQWDSEKGDGPWSLSFKFIASQNVTGLTVGGITGITKKGHEYLWVRFTGDASQNALLQKPTGVYVNEVYRKASFGVLGIGS